jgi:hypothetical protein
LKTDEIKKWTPMASKSEEIAEENPEIEKGNEGNR